MFEEMTYEKILEDMLTQVISDVDKREGSVIYDALAPCAYQLAEYYFSLSNFLDLVSGDTAVGEYLDRVVADYGIIRKVTTCAIRKVVTSGKVQVGTRWGLSDTTYAIKEQLGENVYSAICEQTGEVGNSYSGVLENIDNINGVTATLTDIIRSGEEKETDDNLRKRFYSQIQAPSTSGNADNYKEWALEVPGVGNAKIFPLWNGAGSVKVLIVDSNMEIDESLEQTVYSYVEKLRPVGANVTVESPSANLISVTADLKLSGSKSLDEVTQEFKKVLITYLKSAVFETYHISYAKMGSMLLATSGVSDYSNLLVNESTSNIAIGAMEIPTSGNHTFREVA